VSGSDLDGRCEETDRIHVSGEIPILREVDTREEVPDESQPDLDDSRVIHVRSPKTVSEIQEHRYWKWLHIDVVRDLIKELQISATIAEVRGEVLEANVAREYHEKMELQKALKAERHDKVEIFTRYLHRIYLHRLEESDREYAEESLAEANSRIIAYHIVALGLSDKINEQEKLIREYARRFGSPEDLRKLKEAEENCAKKGTNCKREDYDCISKLLEHHGAGKCPKTTGQRMMDFLEKIANPDTYYNIAQAVYRAFRKK